MQSSFDLLFALKKLGYLQSTRDPLWWPHSGSFEVVVGALLTQQSRWEKVEESLANLKKHHLLSLQRLSKSDIQQLSTLIQPSGFYNTKAQRLLLLSQNILKEFASFENFVEHVDREWLLAQKGIGMESADSILCYACHQPVLVVDSYTQRVLKALGYEFDTYTALQEWMQEGIEANIEKVKALYDDTIELATVYARFHGKIVEYAKVHIRGKEVDIGPLLTYI